MTQKNNNLSIVMLNNNDNSKLSPLIVSQLLTVTISIIVRGTDQDSKRVSMILVGKSNKRKT
jgi:hypothetical protein